MTRQSVGGRANDGGLRIGEMEKDSIVSYGATNFLTESMMERVDKYHLAVCNKSGMTAIYNPSRKVFLSPMMDGPMKFTGLSSAEDIKIENVSQHGRDFSVISVPYTLKLLIQELGCMNIQLRIITEDNIEQLENLASSFDTTGIEEDLKRVVGRKERVIDDPEPEFKQEHNPIEIANSDADEWVVKQDDVIIPEAKPEPNVIPILGEIIYGWLLGMSQLFAFANLCDMTETPPRFIFSNIMNISTSVISSSFTPVNLRPAFHVNWGRPIKCAGSNPYVLKVNSR